MKECAFCSYQGKLSNEHIVSQWIGELFPGPIRAWYGDARRPSKPFTTNTMDWKARVVCEKCNNGWMSDIEAQHAKPVLTPLVTGKIGIPISQKAAESIAVFAFKTAVIVDHANRDREPFFSRRLRYAFRQHLAIPPFVQMWMCGYAGHRAGGHVTTVYHQGEFSSGYRFLMYVCTCAFGNFTFQVLAVKQFGNLGFRSLAAFPKDFAVPFWPHVPKGFVWPHRLALKSREDFDAFAGRWEDIEVIGE